MLTGSRGLHLCVEPDVEDPESWQRLLREQDGLVTRAQARAHGVTDDAIEAHLDAGRWQRLGQGVLAVTTGTPTPAMRHRAALLFIRGPAVLSHESAAAVYRFPGVRDDGPVHVTVPYGSSARGCAGVVVHRSRAFAHITVDSDPPLVSKAHTIIDLALSAPDTRSGMQLFTALATATGIAGGRLLEALELRRPPRYRRALIAAARLLTEGVESILEAEYARGVEQAHGLPAGERQFAVVVEGRRRAEDIRYRAPAGDLLVRLDGWRSHANRRTARIDRARDNAAELRWTARLTFGWEEVHHEPCTTARTVETRLQQLGWTGEAHPCDRCAERRS